MRFLAIIPARYASSRFPGKPLAIIGGKPMIQRVYEQAVKALDANSVLVATDDSRIYDAVLAFGGRAVMTSPNHPCGTNRLAEAYTRIYGAPDANTVVINIQGDEPFIMPEQIDAVRQCFLRPGGEIATLVKPLCPGEDDILNNPNSPKVVVGGDIRNGEGHALYFSRSIIPYLRGVAQEDWLSEACRRGTPYYKHIGLYAYRADILQDITRLPLSPLEQAESLEQLRWLEAGYTIRVATTDQQTIGIDTPADLEAAEIFLQNKNH